MKGFGWDRAAYTRAAGDDAACAGLVPRSDALAYGAAAGTYLLIVAVQVAAKWALTHARVPFLGNLEHPCDAFWCALLRMLSPHLGTRPLVLEAPEKRAAKSRRG